VRDRILEIVVFLMDYMSQGLGHPSSTDDFSSALRSMGYSDSEISSAYFWLMNRFDETPERLFSDFRQSHQSNRILTSAERARLTTDGYGFLIKLLSLSLIDNEQFESILERVSVFGADGVTSEHVKMIASSVVFGEFDDFDSFESDDFGDSNKILAN